MHTLHTHTHRYLPSLVPLVTPEGLGLSFGLFVCFSLIKANEHKNGMQYFVMSIENELIEYLSCQNCTHPVKNDKFC